MNEQVSPVSAFTTCVTYTVNGKKCSPNKAGSKKYAVAWWSDDNYVYVEALIEHTGQGNDYAIVK